MPKKLTADIFIQKARIVHGDKYDYSRIIYNGILKKITIVCPKGHLFEQSPDHHLYRNQGCPFCLPNKKLTQTEFLQRMMKLYGNSLIFDKAIYQNNFTNVSVICPKHGGFTKVPSELFIGNGCVKCSFDIKKTAGETVRISQEDFINNIDKHYPKRFSFVKSVFRGIMEPFIITCYKHGDILVNQARNIVRFEPCAECEQILKQNNFIKRAKEIHGDKYDYSKVIYNLCHKKVIIICKKHGDFLMKPNSHLNRNGCPECRISKGENIISQFLTNHNIDFGKEKKFKDCKDKSLLRFDFYLPDFNTCIEFDGYWHFHPYKHDSKRLENIQRRDRIKNIYCRENHIPLIRISNLKLIEQTLTSILKL